MDPSLHPTSGFHPTWWWLHGGHYSMCENPKDLTKVDDKSVDVDVWKWGIPVWQTVKWRIKKRLTSVLIVVHWWFSQNLLTACTLERPSCRESSKFSVIAFKSGVHMFSLTCHDMSIQWYIRVYPRMVIVIGKLMIKQQIVGLWVTSPRDGWGTGAATPSRAIHNRCLRAQGWKRSMDINGYQWVLIDIHGD